MKNKILAGIMALCLVGGVAAMPEGIASTTFAETKSEEVTGDADTLPETTESGDTTEETAEIVKSGKWGKSGKWSLDADGVLTISGTGVFGGLGDKLTSGELYGLVVEDGITDIAAEAFRDYRKLEYVTLPDTLISIGDGAFYNCESLYDVELPNSLNAIGKSAFLNCESLTSIVIPDSVTGIGASAFQNSGLTTLTIGRGITSIKDWTFNDTSIGKAYYRGTEKEWKAIKIGSFALEADVECLVIAGDSNEDKEVTIADAVLIMQAMVNADEYQMSDIGTLGADVLDAGGGVTSADALAIQMVLANLMTTEDLPVTSADLDKLGN